MSETECKNQFCAHDCSVLLTRLDVVERERDEAQRSILEMHTFVQGLPPCPSHTVVKGTCGWCKASLAEQVVTVVRLFNDMIEGRHSMPQPESDFHTQVKDAIAIWDTQKKKPSKEGENK